MVRPEGQARNKTASLPTHSPSERACRAWGQETPPGTPGDRVHSHHKGLRHPGGPELLGAGVSPQAALDGDQPHSGFPVCCSGKISGLLQSPWLPIGLVFPQGSIIPNRGTVHFGQLPAPTDTAGSYGQSSQAQATPSPEKLNSAFRFSVWRVVLHKQAQ